MNIICIKVCLLFFVFHYSVNAQFLNGGDVSHFSRDGSVIQLNAIQAGESLLFGEVEMLDTTVWLVELDLDFSLSANNQVELFFCSTDSFLGSSAEEFSIKLGRTGSDDALEFYRKNGGVSEFLFEIGSTSFSSANNHLLLGMVNIKNHWELFVQLADTVYKGEFEMSLTKKMSYSGLVLRYTKSNINKVSINHFEVGNSYNTLFNSFTFLSAGQDLRKLHFANQGWLACSDSISVESQQQIIVDSVRVEGTQVLVYLGKEVPINTGISISFCLYVGKEMATKIECVFEVQLTEINEVVISEVMADPIGVGSQIQGGEYIELRNFSERTVSLSGMSLRVGESWVLLPDVFIKPKEHVLFVPEEFFGGHYQNSVVLKNWKALASGFGEIKLINQKQEVVHTFRYDKKYLPKDHRSDGGWSMEIPDQLNFCDNTVTYSSSKLGGTPGFVNSYAASDIYPFDLEKVIYIDNQTIDLEFSHSTSFLFLKDLTSEIPISSVERDSSNETIFRITFSRQMKEDKVYRMYLSPTINQCDESLNRGQGEKVIFGIPDSLAINFIKINEVLFDPLEEQDRFIELVNTSDKVVSLKDFLLAENLSDGSAKELYPCSGVDVLIGPGCYFVLKPKEDFRLQNADTAWQHFPLWDFPVLPNAEGSLSILDKSLKQVEVMKYQESWHSPFLETKKGVSLERVNWTSDALSPSSWSSASPDAGYSTPGRKNSVSGESGAYDEYFKLSSEVLCRNRNEVLTLDYELKQEGYVGTITLFSKEGGVQRGLVEEQLMGRQGSLVLLLSEHVWHVSSGIYVLLIEAVHPTAPHVRERRTITIL